MRAFHASRSLWPSGANDAVKACFDDSIRSVCRFGTWRAHCSKLVPKRSGARFFCKTDDDSLIHHGHLRAALEAAEASAIDGQGRPTKNIIFSYIRWRGWLPNHRLQACGGGWGGPIDAIHHIEDPSTHCGDAEGPFPQGTGTLTCMSAPLARALAIYFDKCHPHAPLSTT